MTKVRAAWPAVTLATGGVDGDDQEWVHATLEAVGDVLMASVQANDVAVLLGWLDEGAPNSGHARICDLDMVGLLDAAASALAVAAPQDMVGPCAMLVEGRDHLRQRAGHLRRPARVVDTPECRLRGVAAHLERTAPGPEEASHRERSPAAGQAIADLLLLGALGADASAAAVAVLQPGGGWSALGYGLDGGGGLNDGRLWSLLAAAAGPVEVPDLRLHPETSASPLARGPLSLRWAYGTALRDPDGGVIAVCCLLDKWPRQATGRDQRVLAAAAGQLTGHLLSLRRPEHVAPPVQPRSGANFEDLRPRSPGPAEGTPPAAPLLLRSHEVAVLFDVTERTVINWASARKLPSLRTIGGHLRFRSDDVHRLLSSRLSR